MLVRLQRKGFLTQSWWGAGGGVLLTTATVEDSLKVSQQTDRQRYRIVQPSYCVAQGSEFCVLMT